MKWEEISKILKSVNVLHSLKLYARKTVANNAVIFVRDKNNVNRFSLGLPPIPITNKTTLSEEISKIRIAIDKRNSMECDKGIRIRDMQRKKGSRFCYYGIMEKSF